MIRTIHQAAAAIQSGDLTPVDLLNECLDRIDRYEERVRAWVFVDRQGALAEAERLTAELNRGYYRGPLHGIPIGVKDIFDVFDWPTAAGSKLWANAIARQDCPVVARLRQAGAIFVGKTVTTAYASFDPPVTRNPWNLARTPGGSSSGSAAAVACGMVLGALASQTGGSITRPASYCGVLGLKPTYGRVSLEGIVPLAPAMDHPGIIAGCVRDLALMYRVIADLGPSDPVTALDGPASNRLAIPGGLFHDRAEPTVRDMMSYVADRLGEHFGIERVALPAAFSEVLARHRTIMAVQAAQYHRVRLARHPDDYPPKVKSLIEEGLATPAPEYADCLFHKAALSREFVERVFGGGKTVLLTPATTGPAPAPDTTGDPAFNSPWSYTGLPTVSLPAGWSPDGLPLCVQLVGAARSEGELLATAARVEAVIGFEAREVPAG